MANKLKLLTKRKCSLIGLLFVAVSALHGQGNNNALIPTGFVNAVGLTTKTDFKIDGQSLKPAGFSEGAYASSFGLTAGNHQFLFSNDGCNTVSASFQAASGYSPLYVLYNAPVRQRNGMVQNFLKLATIPPQPAQGRHFFAYSTLESSLVTVHLNGAPMSLPPLRLAPIQGESLTVDGTGIKPLHVAPREAGNYVLVIFAGSDSQLRWAFVEMTR
jgi:hypothetical protein